MRNFILLSVTLLLSLTSCIKEKENVVDANCNADSTHVGTENIDCSKVFCTQVFQSIVINIRDKQGKAVKLDDFYTIRTCTGEIIRHNKSQWDTTARYQVLTDGYKKTLRHQTARFVFKGIVDGKAIVSQEFIISADCCHVYSDKLYRDIVLQ